MFIIQVPACLVTLISLFTGAKFEAFNLHMDLLHYKKDSLSQNLVILQAKFLAFSEVLNEIQNHRKASELDRTIN